MSFVYQFDGAGRVPPRATPLGDQHLRLGELLMQSGALSMAGLRQALAEYSERRSDSRFGDFLVSEGRISRRALLRAISRQHGLGLVDLTQMASDWEANAGLDPLVCLDLEFVIWHRLGSTLIIAVADPSRIAEIREAIGPVPERLAFAVADSRAIQHELTRLHGPDLAGRARTRCPEQASCRADSLTRFRHMVLAALVLFGAATLFWPQAALTALLVWIVVANFATTLLRGSALATGAWRDPTPRPSTPGVTALADHRQLPMISLLVPLLREDRVLNRLIEALRALDYPRDCLEVKLLLEADDTVTRASLTRVALPPWIDVITVPEDSLRTKPRAMNYALDFCQGGIIGIYDAEDRPDPDQLRKVARRLSEAPRDLACVQARLDFYNPRQNWLTRCFAMEYAVWFAVLLPGMTRLRLPIPLGGTSVFFRRDALDQVGAWDAHNVTEDADLGMRLARHGYRCEMIDSTTHEEANCRMRNWIMQRSRWLKGYAITWMTHMQDPRQLFTDLGPRGFATFQVLFLGAMTSYLALPLFWTLVMLGLLGIRVTDTLDLSGPLWTLFWISMPVGQLVMITAIAIAVRTPAKRALVPWILTLPVYWPLGALAAYRALAELFAKPFHWHKTEHGLAPDTGSD